MRRASLYLEEHPGLVLLIFVVVPFLVVLALTGDPLRAIAAVVQAALTPPQSVGD